MKQLRLTESSILDAIDEVMTDYSKNSTIDRPAFYGYDYSKHIDNPSQEQKVADNEWSREHAFNSLRNMGAPSEYDDEMEAMPGTFGYEEFLINDPNAYGFLDRNKNVDSDWWRMGRYGMMAQGEEDDEDTMYARSQRPTDRQTFAAMDELENQKELDKNDSYYDEYMKFKYAYNPEETPDWNENVMDYNTGRYSMLAQSEDDYNKALGQTKRGTERDSRNAIEQYYDKRLDEAIKQTIKKFLKK